MTIRERYKQVLALLAQERPFVQTELLYKDAFSLLVAVMLSAQCTDKRVNMVTPNLLKAFPDAKAMAQASVEEILSYISSVSYPNSKANHLQQMARLLVDRFSGEVPSSREELMLLPGVGRKTANVMLAVFFNQPAMPVDTHVFRVSERIGLTRGASTVEETERTLVKHIPLEELADVHHRLILHGRYVCLARKPKCSECVLSSCCRYYALANKGVSNLERKQQREENLVNRKK